MHFPSSFFRISPLGIASLIVVSGSLPPNPFPPILSPRYRVSAAGHACTYPSPSPPVPLRLRIRPISEPTDRNNYEVRLISAVFFLRGLFLARGAPSAWTQACGYSKGGSTAIWQAGLAVATSRHLESFLLHRGHGIVCRGGVVLGGRPGAVGWMEEARRGNARGGGRGSRCDPPGHAPAHTTMKTGMDRSRQRRQARGNRTSVYGDHKTHKQHAVK